MLNNQLLGVHLPQGVFRAALGQPSDWRDLEEVDPVMFKNLKSLLDVDLDDPDSYHEYWFSYLVPGDDATGSLPREVHTVCG